MKHPHSAQVIPLKSSYEDPVSQTSAEGRGLPGDNLRTLSSTAVRPRSIAGFLPFGSLWDPDLLDRLTEPLTRYHE